MCIRDSLDTVKNGGKYDGALGVVTGVAALGYLKPVSYTHLADAQKRVDEAYRDEQWWAKAAMLNTACSGKFSSDRTIEAVSYTHLDVYKRQP